MKKLFNLLTVIALVFTTMTPVFAGNPAVSWWIPNDPRFGTINGLSGESVLASKSYNASTYMPTSSANAGDKVAVLIYLHNKGDADSTNTRVVLSPVQSGARSSFTFTGFVSGGGTAISGTTTINLSSSQTLTYIPGSLRVGYDRASVGVSVSNDTDIFTSSGIALNTIPGMHTCGTDALCHQAWVAVGFQVGSQNQNPVYQCNDGYDNDGDGRIDMNDSGCSSSTDDSEYTSSGPTTYQCNDGYDNDGDGYRDYPNDTGCSSYNDDSEYNDYSYNYLSVYTDSYAWINQGSGSVTLYGHYNNNNSYADTYFEYRRIGDGYQSVRSGSSYDSSRSFNVSLYNLTNGDYEYRACVNNASNCGVWRTFSIYQNNYPQNNQTTVQTMPVLYRDWNFATLDGYLNLNGCSSASTYFEYGVNGNYNQTTTSVMRYGSGSIAQSINGLSPNTTYTYRAVANGCSTLVRGNSLSFTTTGQTTVIDNPPTVITRTVINTNNLGGGAQYLRLSIDNGRDTIVRGDELIYVVSWENISKKDLEKLVLEVTMPEGLQVVYAERGQIDHKANAVYVNISSLKAGEKDDMTIRARVNGSFKDNDPITARAIMAFENPVNKAQENAIAYDSDSYLSNTSVLGASIFGLDFLPGTLAGWLLLILILILIVLVIRYALRREQHHHYYTKEDVTVPPPVVTTSSSDDDYTPYRPTPKQ